jgi:tetratricopeptide (TPR) repeat protein
MNRIHPALVLACAFWLATGIGIGTLADQRAGSIDLFQGKEPKEAGLAALEAAERFAGKGSWERIAVGRVYYLSGDTAKGQALFDAVTSGKPEASDWQRIGDVYAQAGEHDKAEPCFSKALAMNAKDDTGQCEVGAWYIRTGQRQKGEELLAKALAKNPTEVWHYVRAAEAYLGVPSK